MLASVADAHENCFLMKTSLVLVCFITPKDFGDRLESLKGLITHEEENLINSTGKKEGNPDLFLVLPMFVTSRGTGSP